MESLNEAVVDIHSKLVVRFDTEIVKSINVLKLVISGDEIFSGLDFYFTWDNLGKSLQLQLRKPVKIWLFQVLKKIQSKFPALFLTS